MTNNKIMFEPLEPKKRCCTPQRSNAAAIDALTDAVSSSCCEQKGSTDEMIQLEGGKYLMGYVGPEESQSDGEGPVREVTLDPFWLDQTTVSNEQFEQFVQATNYLTESERFGWAYVFIGQLSKSKQRKLRETKTVPGLQWWYAIDGAYWRKPARPLKNAWITLWSACLGTMPLRMRAGPVSGCPLKRSGSMPRAAPMRGACTHGGVTLSRMANTAAMFGRAISLCPTRRKMVMNGLRRCVPFARWTGAFTI